MNMRLLNLVVSTHELKGAAYQVMLALAWHASVTNECSISISDLAADAHLTKKSVISALHLLTMAQGPTDRRSILTKAKQGIGVGIPNTYLINLDLMRDLSRRRRYQRATGARGDGKAGNLAIPVEHPLTRTLTGEISPNAITGSGFSISQTSKPLSQREVNK